MKLTSQILGFTLYRSEPMFIVYNNIDYNIVLNSYDYGNGNNIVKSVTVNDTIRGLIHIDDSAVYIIKYDTIREIIIRFTINEWFDLLLYQKIDDVIFSIT